MAKQIMLLLLVQLLVATLGDARAHNWAKTVHSGKEATTSLQFYFHDTVGGKKPTAVVVAHDSNSTQYPLTGFGAILMADDPLTEGPDPNSKLVGRAQGLYGSACQQELQLIMAMSYSFVDGVYNGSSISIMGRNSVMQPVRELALVGGTGMFRMARGYAIAQTHWLGPNTAIVGYNVTVIH